MKNSLAILLVVAAAPVMSCFSQSQANQVTAAGAALVNVNDVFAEYKIGPLNNLGDTLRVLDSILLVITEKKVMVESLIEEGFSTSADVRLLWGYPDRVVPFPNNENKKKWVYDTKIVFFVNDIVVTIIETNGTAVSND